MISLPILLVHGFNGYPSNWTGPKDRFPEFLAAHGYDPELIRVFNYGYQDFNGKRVYKNTGDLRGLAHRLDEYDTDDAEARASQVDRLARDSAARGGPQKITIIAHSSGGLIVRYYLSRAVEDEFGTRYRGKVARLIMLGTPHQGVDVEDFLDPLPTNFLIYRLMLRLHFLFPPDYREQGETLQTRFAEMGYAAREEWFTDESKAAAAETPAFKQMHPGSEFLKEINRPGALPRDIEYFNIIGDIRASVKLEWWHRAVFDFEKSFGDLLVSTQSAGSIPNAPSQLDQIVETPCLEVDLSRHLSRLVHVGVEGDHPIPIHRHLRWHPKAREYMLDILARTR